jgi:hypothetical protein
MISFRAMRRTMLVVACLTAVYAGPDAEPLPVKHGVYVQKAVACKGAPNAANRVWDGIGLSGAHSSKCTSRIVSRNGSTFKMTTACSALGDGFPDFSGLTEELMVSSVSKKSFAIARGIQPGIAYRWCSAGAPN